MRGITPTLMNPVSTQTLVNELRQRGYLADWRLENAFASVSRHRFLPDAALEIAYSADTSVLVCFDTDGEALCAATMPSMIAYMLEQLDLFEGANVLEIGTGTGYVAALLRHIVGDSGTVTTLEIDRSIVRLAEDNLLRAAVSGVKVVHVDGAEGYAPRAAFDRIMSAVGLWDIPTAWIRQLKPHGRIVAPVSIDGLQVMAAFTLQPGGDLYAEHAMPSAFVYIRGQAAPPPMRKRIGSTALTLIADEVDKIDSVALHVLLSSDHEQSGLSVALNTSDYWYGFLPYMMLNEPEKEIFALYDVVGGQKAYGIDGEGFAVFTPASACFVPYYGLGHVNVFAGADALMAVEAQLAAWQRAGRPSIDRLRLHFIPKAQHTPEITQGRLFARYDHWLHAWLDMDDVSDHPG